jgi:nucleoporin NDC1
MLTNAIAKPSTRRCLAVYMSCTLMLITLYMSSFTSEERESLRLNVFVKSRYVIQQTCPEDSCVMRNLIPNVIKS